MFTHQDRIDMNAQSQELERFKVEINLADYAASMGYEIDAKESSMNSIVMRGPQNDKIIIARGTDRHWIYFSVRNDNDHGTIIDFHQNRSLDRLGKTRKILRPWVDSDYKQTPNPRVHTSPTLQPSPTDEQQVLTAYHRMKIVTYHPYLETRAITGDILSCPRFHGRIRIDQQGNAIFPHFGENHNLIGFEIKNRRFTGFSSGGQKGLWLSHDQPNDDNLVFCESAIDALSHYAIHLDKNTRYASTAGRLGPTAKKALRRIALEHSGTNITLAFDRDNAGEALSRTVSSLLQGLQKNILIQVPKAKDWNENLKNTCNS